MPIYEYVCKRCRAGFEAYLRRMDAPQAEVSQLRAQAGSAANAGGVLVHQG